MWVPRETEYLSAEGWYECGHNLDGEYWDKRGIWYPKVRSGVYVWEPMPAAASAAMEELRFAHRNTRGGPSLALAVQANPSLLGFGKRVTQHNILKHDAVESSQSDRRLLDYICHANINVCWLQTNPTVTGVLTGLCKGL
eukprot:8259729-Ditylum_brightwellii.AAC.1